jgi:hypothetical protein
MLAFAPLVRIKRRHPADFSEARVERMLGL